MNTTIIYMTKHGTAEKAARILEEKIRDNVQIINLKQDKNPDLSDFDTIIIGGSIHIGKIQKGIKNFCIKNMNILLRKRIGLYLCCMEQGTNACKQFDDAFPLELRKHASATGQFGGEFYFQRMNFIERAIIKKIANIEESISKLDVKAIDKFLDEILGDTI
ncbi:MAG: flavodoxin domain-containing protein [Spirochaetes bacterium]|nr:flavodoxin domain-containing protein [Spirochaetota bacterium]